MSAVATQAEPKEYRMTGGPMASAPGIVRWAINGYKFKKDRKAMERVLLAWPIPIEAIRALLSESVPYTVEGEVVIFTA